MPPKRGTEPRLVSPGDLGGVRPGNMADFQPPNTDQDVIDFRTKAEDEAITAFKQRQAEQESARVGMPVSVWESLSEVQRAEIQEHLPTPQRKTEADLPRVEREEFAAVARGGEDAMARLIRELVPAEDQRSYTLMCDPVKEYTINGVKQRYHPGTSKIHRVMVSQQREKGFTLTPIAPFLPKPTRACDMTDSAVTGLLGVACPYVGYTEADIEIHMRTAHPLEFDARKDRLAREREEVLLENARIQTQVQQAQLKLLEKQIDGGA